jgi:hypothetical protein
VTDSGRRNAVLAVSFGLPFLSFGCHPDSLAPFNTYFQHFLYIHAINEATTFVKSDLLSFLESTFP